MSCTTITKMQEIQKYTSLLQAGAQARKCLHETSCFMSFEFLPPSLHVTGPPTRKEESWPPLSLDPPLGRKNHGRGH